MAVVEGRSAFPVYASASAPLWVKTVRSGLNGGSRFKSRGFDEVFAELKLKALPPFRPPLCRAPEALGLEMRFFHAALL
ncbi:hypothetical protein P4V43_07450 [Brevibacillus fortis]|uniref:hypothetical protein n=1 Tax=Brevibacillus fortis TaxID=2126352 RepID=UPI002E219DAB|nr:hypothetical protein [Brevibacillus fortis]